jgi:hypothetical protein
MIASSSARQERGISRAGSSNGKISCPTSKDLHPTALRSKISQEVSRGAFSQEVKRGAFSLSFLARASNDVERKKAEDRKNSEEEDDELSLGKLPDQSERLKGSPVMKLCQEEWQPRFIYMTGIAICSSVRNSFLNVFVFPADDLLIAIPGSDDISDRIPLVRSC